MRTSLPASTTLPFTVAALASCSGIDSASFRSAGPPALASASALLIQPPTGEALT